MKINNTIQTSTQEIQEAEQIQSHLVQQYFYLDGAVSRNEQKEIKTITENISALKNLKRITEAKSLPDFVNWVQKSNAVPDAETRMLIIEIIQKYAKAI